jgi:trimeric autotransporter adhesin
MSELLVTHTGEVVIVGDLPNIGGTGSINNIAHWDGTAWRAFGPGLPGNLVAATECPNGDIVVYGLFFNGGNPAATERYARWDGTTWQLFGGVTTEMGQVLRACPNGDLLFGGTFIDVANTPNDHGIARWNGTAWQSLGTGVASNFNNAQVHAILVARNGDIIIGGNFNSVGDGSTLMENFGIYRATVPNGLAPVAPGAAKLTIAPNPAHGRIQATFSAGYTGPLALYDMTGRTIRTRQVSATTAQPGITLDLVGVAPGAYLLRAGTTMQRVLID